MAKEFPVRILSADEVCYEGPCVSLRLPTWDGMLGVMAGESNLVAALVPGVLHCRTQDGEDHVVSIANGIFKMEHGEALVLTETLEKQSEIDVERAEASVREAREHLYDARQRHQEYLQVEAELSRALARLRAAGRVQ